MTEGEFALTLFGFGLIGLGICVAAIINQRRMRRDFLRGNYE